MTSNDIIDSYAPDSWVIIPLLMLRLCSFCYPPFLFIPSYLIRDRPVMFGRTKTSGS
jgi:hypothetical protein